LISVSPNVEALIEAAAELFVKSAQTAVDEHGEFTVALAGGHSPKPLYTLLAQPPYSKQVPWEKTHVFWGDERCVPPDDPRNNATMASQALLSHLTVPPDHVHPIRCHESPGLGAKGYESILAEHFLGTVPRFDLILLGLGQNGHTASLFPYTPILGERERWVKELFLPEEEVWRVSLTIPLINNGATIIFLVYGSEKSEILRKVLEGPHEPNRYPAQFIQPVNGKLIWMIDSKAAGKLQSSLAAGVIND